MIVKQISKNTFFATLVFALLTTTLSVTTGPASASETKCTISGTKKSDRLVGTAGKDVICGKGGNDIILGEGGDDLIIGGPGDDQIDGGDGADELYGEIGDDEISGGPGGDLLFGGDGSDALNAGDGDDEVQAGVGNDTVQLGPGVDKAFGGAGADRLFGDAGSDQLFGEQGTDWLGGGDGVDVLNGGSGITYCDSVAESSVSSCFFDNTSPILVSLAVEPSSRVVDARSGLAVVTIRARIVDFGTGVDQATLYFSPEIADSRPQPIFNYWEAAAVNHSQCVDGHAEDLPSGITNMSVCRISGDANDGIYEFKSVLSPYLKEGRQYLSRFWATDKSNFSTHQNSVDLASFNLDVTFQQSGYVETKSPTINSIALSPAATYDTSESPAFVDVRFNYRDDTNPLDYAMVCFAKVTDFNRVVSGGDPVRYCLDYAANFRPLDAGNRQYPECYTNRPNTTCSSLSQVSGTDVNGIYAGRILLPAGFAPGKFRLVEVRLRDRAYNELNLTRSQIGKSKLLKNIGFSQTGPGSDPAGGGNELPDSGFELLSTVVDSNSISTGFGAASFELTVRAKIAHGEFKRLGIWVGNDGVPDGYINSDTYFRNDNQIAACGASGPQPNQGCLYSGTKSDGVFKYKFVIPAHFRQGTLRIKYIYGEVPGYKLISISDHASSPITPNVVVVNG